MPGRHAGGVDAGVMGSAVRLAVQAARDLDRERETAGPGKCVRDFVELTGSSDQVDFDEDDRPRTYFGIDDLQVELLGRVKGVARREVLRAPLDAGRIAEVPDEVKQAALPESQRQAHPLPGRRRVRR
jgi:hypothetical protein